MNKVEAQAEQSTGWFSNVTSFIPGVKTAREVNKTLTQVGEVSTVAANILNDPEKLAYNITRGVMRAIAQPNGEGQEPGSLFGCVQQLVADGVTIGSAEILERLLGVENDTNEQNVAEGENPNNARTKVYDLDEGDKNLIKESVEALKNAKLKKDIKTVKKVLERLNRYHIFVGGTLVNDFGTSSNIEMQGYREKIDQTKTHDGLNPIYSLVKCQEGWRNLRTTHALNQPAPIPNRTASVNAEAQVQNPSGVDLQKLQDQTDEKVQNFCNKTVHLATMHAIHALFNHSTNPTLYNKFLGEADIKNSFLKRFDKGSFRYHFYRIIYQLLHWLINPLITQTTEKAVNSLRNFLNNDSELLNFIERQISNMADYYGQVEKGRQAFLADTQPGVPGTFDRFLKTHIRLYGGADGKQFTKEQLIHICYEYVVQNCVPKPRIAICGWRIPIISPLLEWIVHSIRKAIVGHLLKKAKIVEKLLTPEQKGTSINYVTLGGKRMLVSKLQKIVEMIDRSRIRRADSRLLERESQAALTAKKARLISPWLHLQINQHSKLLLRTIDTFACNGDTQQLRRLDNKLLQLADEVVGVFTNVLKWKPQSIETVLQDASTEVIETAILTLFEDKPRQIEEQLQAGFDILTNSYRYVPEEERQLEELKLREEYVMLDSNQKTLMEQISCSSIEISFKNYMTNNAGGEKYNANTNYVKAEKEIYQEFQNSLNSDFQALKELADSMSTSAQLKNQISTVVSLIERYLTHFSVQLNSLDLKKCFSDVRGDIHNNDAAIIHTLQTFLPEMEKIATTIDQIKEQEASSAHNQAFTDGFQTFCNASNLAEAAQAYKILKQTLPLTVKDQASQLLDEIFLCRQEQQECDQMLSTYDLYTDLKQQEAQWKESKQQAIAVEKQMVVLSELIRKYQDSSPKREQILGEIRTLYKTIKANPDKRVKAHIAPLLKAKTTKELHRVFYSPFMSSRVPLFANLSQFKQTCQKQINTVTTQLAHLKTPTDLKEGLQNKQQQLQKKIIELNNSMLDTLEQNKIRINDEIKMHCSSISTSINQEFAQIAKTLSNFDNQFKVKGCISVGELEFWKDAADKGIAFMIPKIIDGICTFSESMAHPPHDGNVLLKTVGTEIARLHKGAA